MSDTLQKEKLAIVINEATDISFEEKRNNKSEEEIINTFLDAILDFQQQLTRKTNKINSITSKIEEVTWFTNLEEAELKDLNNLISVAKDIRVSLIREYIKFNYFRTRGIAKKEISSYKKAIDDFTESYTDLESVLFKLPHDHDFQEITKLLNEI